MCVIFLIDCQNCAPKLQKKNSINIKKLFFLFLFPFTHEIRCDNAGENGITRLATVRCPTGLAFDVKSQTCDWKTNVKNCDQVESKFYGHSIR